MKKSSKRPIETKIRRTKVRLSTIDIVGPHPVGGLFGSYTEASDGHTSSDVPHRSVDILNDKSGQTIVQLRKAVIKHHADSEKIARIKRQLERLGCDITKLPTCPIPSADKTRKGNLAEVFLAEYILASAESEMPVYRLRFNPNIEQSMKGDDVLAFDFNKNPVRIFVGEAKFRATASKVVVKDMVKALQSSHRAGIPASLQFIADRLFDEGNDDLGEQVEKCAEQIAHGNHDMRYVGLLMSTVKCKSYIDEYVDALLPNMAILSFSSNEPNSFFKACYDQIEEEAFGSSK